MAARCSVALVLLEVSTVDWIAIILCIRQAKFSGNSMTRSVLMQTMQELQSEYEQLPEVQAYDDVNATPPPKKARKTARSPGPAEAKHE